MPNGLRIMGLARHLKTFQLRLAMLALVVMMGIIVVDVAMRYLFGRPIRGSYDLVEASLVVFVFHGMAACFFARQNIVIDLIDTLAGERAAAILIRISDIISLALLALMIWAMLSPARQAFQYGDRKLELGLPIWVLWVFAIAGLAGTMLCAAGAMTGNASKRHGGERL